MTKITENNFSENWISWVRNCPSSEVGKVKESLKKIMSEVNAEPISEDTWKNYFYKRIEVPARFRGPIVDFARGFDKNPDLTLDFTFIKEKINAEA